MSPPPSPQETRIFTAGFMRLVAIQMAFGVSYSAFLLLPKFLRTEFSASATEIGWMVGITLVVAAVLSPVVGAISSRVDRRLLLGAALLMQGGAALGFVWVSEVGPLVYVLRFVQGAAFVIIFNCTVTLVADQVPAQKLGQAVGYLGLSMLCTNALAPALAEPLASRFGWKIVFGLSGAFVLASLVFVRSLGAEKARVLSAELRPRHVTGLGPVYYGSMLVGAGLGTLFTFVQPYALSQGATDVGDFFLGYVGAAVFVRSVFATVPDRLGPSRVAGAALVLYSVVTIAAAEVTPHTLSVLGFFLGVSHGFIYPALSAHGLTLAPPAMRSVFMGWFTCAFNTGFAIAVLVLGPLADRFGYPPIFIATGIWVSTGILPLLLPRARTRAAIVTP